MDIHSNWTDVVRVEKLFAENECVIGHHPHHRWVCRARVEARFCVDSEGAAVSPGVSPSPRLAATRLFLHALQCRPETELCAASSSLIFQSIEDCSRNVRRSNCRSRNNLSRRTWQRGAGGGEVHRPANTRLTSGTDDTQRRLVVGPGADTELCWLQLLVCLADKCPERVQSHTLNVRHSFLSNSGPETQPQTQNKCSLRWLQCEQKERNEFCLF